MPQAVEFREIRIQQRWQEKVDDDGEFYYELTPVRKINANTDVTMTNWKPLPSNK